jgi:hypothetical protein
MRIKSWTIAGLVVIFSIPVPAGQDVAELLHRQTQELMDAVGAGARPVWERYLDAGAVYTDEGGSVMSKPEMLATIRPFAQGVSGKIKVLDFKVAVHGSTAVATHLDDEYESYHGHELHCQYRTTDTWVKTRAGWRIVAGQVLALRTDPPAVSLTPRQMEEYAGRYALTPAMVYEIRNNGGVFEGQRTDGKPETLQAEVPDVLFVGGKPRYRKVFLRGSDGRITGFAERREAWDLIWKRLP